VKRKNIILVSLLTIVFLLSGAASLGMFREDGIKREKLLAQLIHTGLQRWHYSGKKIDDNFSRKAFTEFLEYLDYRKGFLLQGDIEELRKYRDEIDDQFAAGSTEMMEAALRRLKQRIHQVMDFYPALLAKPFDFTQKESLESDSDKRTYCSSLEELKEYWRKTLKYRTLLHYIAQLKANKKNNKKELEEKSRQAVLKNLKTLFNRMLQGIENDSFSRYLNSLVQVYDPHTYYFAPVDRETFEMQVLGSFEGIGALLREEDNYVKVASIVPGGPSWRQKQLQPEDLILKVAQGDEYPVDIIGMRVQDAVKLIRGKKGTLVRLTVKKPDGEIMEIPIVRDVVIIEETFARGAVLVHKKLGKRFGYIHLPVFYNDFTRANGRNSTDDVRKELEKLKLKKVEGIILDLRNNSGGILLDAVRMSGLFISQGPIVQVKNKRSRVEVLRDPDPGTSYSGPLVILVNTLSASASEILAAALQDFNRAAIVGARSYGKGTVQTLVNLDKFIHGKSEESLSLGALTITIQKFYRVDGTSIQLKGVIPDILLPDRFAAFEIGEKHLDHTLEWDSVPPVDYEKWEPRSPVSEEIAAKSRARVRENNGFKEITEYIKNVKRLQETTRQNLQITEMIKRQEKLKKEREKLKKSPFKLAHIDLLPSGEPGKRASASLDKIAKERQEEWFKTIKKDLFLGEALEILNDMITHEMQQ